jgi:hypothetical protein
MDESIVPGARDALLVVDLQKDFLPDGALGVTDGDTVVAPSNCVPTTSSLEGIGTPDGASVGRCYAQFPARSVSSSAQFSTRMSSGLAAACGGYHQIGSAVLFYDLRQSCTFRLHQRAYIADGCVLFSCSQPARSCSWAG